VSRGTHQPAAASDCQALSANANLVSIHSDAENEFVATLGGSGGRWIGLERTGTGPTDFVWMGKSREFVERKIFSSFIHSFLDGSAFDYTDWYADKPDDVGGNENCVAQGQNSFNNITGWNNVR